MANIFRKKTCSYNRPKLDAFYFSLINRYWLHVYRELYILGRKICIGGKYTLYLMFWVGNKISATGQVLSTYLASYFVLEDWYLQPIKSQIYIWLHILDKKKLSTTKQVSAICLVSYFNLENRYLQLARSQLSACFYFWVRKQILAIGQVISICPVLYFGWENRNLKPASLQLYLRLDILTKKTYMYD